MHPKSLAENSLKVPQGVDACSTFVLKEGEFLFASSSDRGA